MGRAIKSVIVLSVERSGGSWMCAIISEIHKRFYGKPIYWDFEISRLMAIHEKYNLPITYSTVYYVKPSWLLKRGYDKIIILQKPLDLIIEAMVRYRIPKFSVEEAKRVYPDYIKKIEFYYNFVYGDKIEDPRILRVQLSDLNNYTVEEYGRVLDFLEYPYRIKAHTTLQWCENYDKEHPMCEAQECGKCMTFQPKKERPILLPIRVKRDWDLQATIINKGHPFGPRILDMIRDSGVQEGEMPITNPDLVNDPQATQHGYKKSKIQYVNYEKPNPYKMTPEEWDVQNHQVYRILPIPMGDILEEMGYI